MVGERPTEWHAVSSEGPEEAVARPLSSACSPQAPVASVGSWLQLDRIAIHGRRKESQQLTLSLKVTSLIAAQCQVGRKDWEVVP